MLFGRALPTLCSQTGAGAGNSGTPPSKAGDSNRMLRSREQLYEDATCAVHSVSFKSQASTLCRTELPALLGIRQSDVKSFEDVGKAKPRYS